MALINSLTLEEEMKKDPEIKKRDIEALKEWHKKQPHLPKMNDSEFALFLHANYYRIETTKLTIDSFYTLRTHIPEFFNNRNPMESKPFRNIIKCM